MCGQERTSEALGAIIGEDATLRAALARARLVAPTSMPVLVGGESGTGKELLARALHELGPQPDGAPRRGELRRAAAGAGRERAVRPRARGVHRRGGTPRGLVRGGFGGDAGARRDRRAAARSAAEAAARARDRAAPPRRRNGRDQRPRAGRRHDVARSRGRGAAAGLPGGSLLPAGGVQHPAAAAARAAGRHPAAGHALPARDRGRGGAAPPRGRGAGDACAPPAGRATSASCATRSGGPRS